MLSLHCRIVEVWIPSAIKRGRGPDAHHEYQVYIKLGNEEWNVYRRYAQMHEFHKQLQKNLQGMEEFIFPPKKAIKVGGRITNFIPSTTPPPPPPPLVGSTGHRREKKEATAILEICP